MAILATPVSHLFLEDKAADLIIDKSDCLEGRERMADYTLGRQLLIHFEKSIVDIWQDDEKIFIEDALNSRKELEVASFHISSSCSEPILKDAMFYPGGREYSREEMLFNARSNIDWIKGILGDRSTELAVENNNYYTTGAYRYVTEADFIRRLVEENGISLLFDMGHAHVTAINTGGKYEDYISLLPLDKAIQIHISKHALDEQGNAYDAHALPDDETFAGVRDIMEKYPVRYMTVEYYKDVETLIRLLERLRLLSEEREGIR